MGGEPFRKHYVRYARTSSRADDKVKEIVFVKCSFPMASEDFQGVYGHPLAQICASIDGGKTLSRATVPGKGVSVLFIILFCHSFFNYFFFQFQFMDKPAGSLG